MHQQKRQIKAAVIQGRLFDISPWFLKSWRKTYYTSRPILDTIEENGLRRAFL